MKEALVIITTFLDAFVMIGGAIDPEAQTLSGVKFMILDHTPNYTDGWDVAANEMACEGRPLIRCVGNEHAVFDPRSNPGVRQQLDRLLSPWQWGSYEDHDLLGDSSVARAYNELPPAMRDAVDDMTQFDWMFNLVLRGWATACVELRDRRLRAPAWRNAYDMLLVDE